MSGTLIATRHRCLGRPTASGFELSTLPAVRQVPRLEGHLAWVTEPGGCWRIYWYATSQEAGAHEVGEGETLSVTFRSGYFC